MSASSRDTGPDPDDSETRRPTDGATDEDLAGAARSGDARAFELLVERFDRRVYGLCRAILRDRHEANDAMQEAFLRAYRALDGYDIARRFAPWILRIAANVSRDIGKKKRPQPLADPPDDYSADADDPELILSGREDVARLRAAIDELREPQRTIMTLFAIQGMSAADVAETLGISETNVGVQVYRAKGRLRSALTRNGRGPT